MEWLTVEGSGVKWCAVEEEGPGNRVQLRARGVEFTEPPEERFYGIDASFRDPFGNPWRLTQARNLDDVRSNLATEAG